MRNLLLCVLFACSGSVYATYSIITINDTTKEIGAALATCNLDESRNVVQDAPVMAWTNTIMPGQGVFQIQGLAYENPRRINLAIDYLQQQNNALSIINAMRTDSSDLHIDGSSAIPWRQMAVLTFAGSSSASYTGNALSAEANSIEGNFRGIRYIIAGNRLAPNSLSAMNTALINNLRDNNINLQSLLSRTLNDIRAQYPQVGDSACIAKGSLSATHAYIKTYSIVPQTLKQNLKDNTHFFDTNLDVVATNEQDDAINKLSRTLTEYSIDYFHYNTEWIELINNLSIEKRFGVFPSNSAFTIPTEYNNQYQVSGPSSPTLLAPAPTVITANVELPDYSDSHQVRIRASNSLGNNAVSMNSYGTGNLKLTYQESDNTSLPAGIYKFRLYIQQKYQNSNAKRLVVIPLKIVHKAPQLNVEITDVSRDGIGIWADQKSTIKTSYTSKDNFSVKNCSLNMYENHHDRISWWVPCNSINNYHSFSGERDLKIIGNKIDSGTVKTNTTSYKAGGGGFPFYNVDVQLKTQLEFSDYYGETYSTDSEYIPALL